MTLFQIGFTQCVCEWLCVFCWGEPWWRGFQAAVWQSCCLRLINSSVFEHVSTTVHHCWLRLCIIVICLLATWPHLHIYSCVDTKQSQPALKMAPAEIICSYWRWWQIFHGIGCFMQLCANLKHTMVKAYISGFDAFACIPPERACARISNYVLLCVYHCPTLSFGSSHKGRYSYHGCNCLSDGERCQYGVVSVMPI